jgi:nanoRNase/pAp phosphatase (c-di-AMP/oligoRNAs hydrolase)
MALAPHEQFVEAIKRSRSVAVVLPSALSVDALSGGLAMARFVETYGKPAEIICAGFSPEPHLSFLPGIDKVKPNLVAPRHTVLSIPLPGGLHELSHEVADGFLHIKITPTSGNVNAEGMCSAAGGWRHDLLIAVCLREPKELGALLSDHRAFFEETPVINIDTHPANEHHGTINIVDLKCGATSELITSLIEAIDAKRMDADTATCLLAGIIGETKSFRSSAVTPRTLETAGRLVLRGARREQIVEALFRTRPVEALRLWGRVLARLKADREHKLVWSVLGRADFMHAGADETHLSDVIDELVSRAPDAEVVFLLHEHPQTEGVVRGIISAERGWNALELGAQWQATGGSKRAHLETTGVTIGALEQQLLNSIRQTVALNKNR